jgi:hypothetical protein
MKKQKNKRLDDRGDDDKPAVKKDAKGKLADKKKVDPAVEEAEKLEA